MYSHNDEGKQYLYHDVNDNVAASTEHSLRYDNVSWDELISPKKQQRKSLYNLFIISRDNFMNGALDSREAQ